MLQEACLTVCVHAGVEQRQRHAVPCCSISKGGFHAVQLAAAAEGVRHGAEHVRLRLAPAVPRLLQRGTARRKGHREGKETAVACWPACSECHHSYSRAQADWPPFALQSASGIALWEGESATATRKRHAHTSNSCCAASICPSFTRRESTRLTVTGLGAQPCWRAVESNSSSRSIGRASPHACTAVLKAIWGARRQACMNHNHPLDRFNHWRCH